jgi:uncharacterized protein involved in oxidation of intracellular sulfur
MSENEEKILYVSTHGEENLDKATVPFVLANAALAMDTQATVVLQTNAVVFATIMAGAQLNIAAIEADAVFVY